MRIDRTLKKTALAAAMLMSLNVAVADASETIGYQTHVLPDALVFEPLDRQAMNSEIDLILKGPDDYLSRTRFAASTPIEFNARGLADGSYRYELRLMGTPGMVSSRSSSTRASEIVINGGSGAFSIQNGRLVDPATSETASATIEGKNTGVVTDSIATDLDQGDSTRDQVVIDDQIVIGSLCVGQDCVNGENFGFDTIRLKENNLRIRFDDTSNSAGFPNVDWQLTANDSTNGGANKFSIEDLTNARVPFTIEAVAPSNALYVDDAGNVGLGTSTPVVEQHIVDGDSPTVRLEQNGSSGFTPQTWDMAGNETNFFVRDVTNGSRLPFKIRPNSPTDALVLEPAGTRLNNMTTFSANVGIGVTTADHPLQVRGDGGAPPVRIEQASSINLTRELLLLTNNGGSTIQFDDSSGDLHDWQLSSTRFGFFITEEDSQTTEFILSRGTGNLAIAGTLTENSDLDRKTNITPVDPAEVLARVVELPISTWAYKEDDQVLHLGPMAQDFYQQFGLGSSERQIATIDTSGVALAAIKGLKQELDRKNAEIRELRTEIERLGEAADAQAELVGRIENLAARLITVEQVQDAGTLAERTQQLRVER
ncbi:MAG: tail fiber domain-containing protein [Wenzhouxiangellaceae bacterium]